MMINKNCLANIRLFRQTSKGILTRDKRRTRSIRSGLFCFFLTVSPAFASFEDLTAGARFAALADAGVAYYFAADCIFLNPAGHLNPNRHFDVHLFYTKPFGLDDLSLGNCAMRYSHKNVGGAVALQSFGNSIYREHQFLLSAAWRAFPTVTVGATCRYGLLSIQHYGQTQSVMLDLGMIARLSPKLYWGCSIKNAGNAKVGLQREALPTVLTSGVCLQPHANVSLLFDVSKDTRFPMDARCGVDYNVLGPLSLRVGAGLEPTRYCAGFSLALRRVRIDYAFSSHFELGLTHMFSIGIY